MRGFWLCNGLVGGGCDGGGDLSEPSGLEASDVEAFCILFLDWVFFCCCIYIYPSIFSDSIQSQVDRYLSLSIDTYPTATRHWAYIHFIK